MANSLAIGKAIRTARDKQGWSQGELGRKIGTSQGTVSRLELGFQVTPEVLRKTLDILKPEIVPSPELLVEKLGGNFYRKPTIDHTQMDIWGISYFKYSPKGASGDCIAFGNVGKKKFSLMIGDAVGTGYFAERMAQALEFGFHAARHSASSAFFSADGLRITLEKSFQATKSMWEGPPSVAFVVADDTKGFLDLLNCGMPTPLVFSRKAADTKWAYYNQDSQLAALGSGKNPVVAKPNVFESQPGDAFLFYSDGFKEGFERLGEGKLTARFNEAARLLIGDSKGILLNLIEQSGDKRKLLNAAEDDMCVLVICRKRESEK